jgi:hypothetical protein
LIVTSLESPDDTDSGCSSSWQILDKLFLSRIFSLLDIVVFVGGRTTECMRSCYSIDHKSNLYDHVIVIIRCITQIRCFLFADVAIGLIPGELGLIFLISTKPRLGTPGSAMRAPLLTIEQQ